MLPPRGSDDVRPATTSAVSTAPEVPQLWREDESQANPWTTIRTGRESSGIVSPSGKVSDTPVFFPDKLTRVVSRTVPFSVSRKMMTPTSEMPLGSVELTITGSVFSTRVPIWTPKIGGWVSFRGNRVVLGTGALYGDQF